MTAASQHQVSTPAGVSLTAGGCGGAGRQVKAAASPPRRRILAAPLVAEIDAFLATGVMLRSKFQQDCLRSPTALPRLRKPNATIRVATAARIREFIAGHSKPAIPEGGPLPENPTGAELADALERAAAAKRIGIGAFIAPLTRHSTNFIHQLRAARKPKPLTVERIRALLAGEPIPPGRPHAEGVVWCKREQREDLGLPPSGRQLRDERVISRVTDERSKLAHLRDVAETRQSERTRRIQDVVNREAADRSLRRAEARMLSGVAHPLDLSDVVGDALVDQIDTASDRRERELEELASPSSVLRRAQRDWPEQCEAVKALAAELGVQLGEAWRRVIAAGVETLNDPEAI